MYELDTPALGIYEKALPRDTDWHEKLALAATAGYEFVELSIDETDQRLARLDWSETERARLRDAVATTGVRVPSLCLSGHRRFPLGSEDPATRERALAMMKQAIELAVDVGVRTIQLAGYDVYYDPGNATTRRNFVDGLRRAVRWASKAGVMLSVEIMDHPLMNSIGRFLDLAEQIRSPWFSVYPDIGNLSAWGNDIEHEFTRGIERITAIHLKDTKAVTGTFGGQFRDVPFGEGCVDFVACFSILRKLGYTGPFVIEMWTERAADPMQTVRDARAWILEQMAAGGYVLW